MTYLDIKRLNSIDPTEFRNRKPYPWINPAGIILEDAHRRLVDSLPDISLFARAFGQKRKYNQTPHNRFTLEYSGQTNLPQPWKEFIGELQKLPYRTFLQNLFQVESVAMRFHWLFTPNGCSVSPHCDGANEVGTHIFYLNTPEDWDSAWGGSTLILDDGHRIPHDSAPWFDSFDSEIAADSLGNYSLLFKRTDHSWHGVREIHCPETKMRKIFSVIVSSNEPGDRFTRLWRRPRYNYF